MQETDFQGQSEKKQDPKSFNNIHNLFELQKKKIYFIVWKPSPKIHINKEKQNSLQRKTDLLPQLLCFRTW